MKILRLVAVIIFALVSSGSFAQSQNQAAPASSNTTVRGTKDYVVMQNGKMMEFKNGKLTELSETFACTNGDKVSTAGKIIMTDGTTRTLKEGDKVYIDGKLEAATTKSQNQANPPNPAKQQ